MIQNDTIDALQSPNVYIKNRDVEILIKIPIAVLNSALFSVSLFYICPYTLAEDCRNELFSSIPIEVSYWLTVDDIESPGVMDRLPK